MSTNFKNLLITLMVNVCAVAQSDAQTIVDVEVGFNRSIYTEKVEVPDNTSLSFINKLSPRTGKNINASLLKSINEKILVGVKGGYQEDRFAQRTQFNNIDYLNIRLYQSILLGITANYKILNKFLISFGLSNKYYFGIYEKSDYPGYENNISIKDGTLHVYGDSWHPDVWQGEIGLQYSIKSFGLTLSYLRDLNTMINNFNFIG